MDWKGWNNKNVSLKLINGKEHLGKVIDVDISGGELIWITIENKKGKEIGPFVNSEIRDIKEVIVKQKLKEVK